MLSAILSPNSQAGERASSLAETVVGVFLLIACFLVVARLFHASLQMTRRANHRIVAARIAEKKMTEIRAWARKPSNWDNRWASDYSSTPQPDPDEPTYLVTVNQENHKTLSPSTALETRWVASGKEKAFNNSFRKVTITVSWSAQPQDRLSITTLVGDPARQLAANPIQITFPAGRTHPLPANAIQKMKADLIDNSGQPIRDVCFTWYVLPSRTDTIPSGNGIIDTDSAGTKRHGRRVDYRNIYPHPGGWTSVSGNVRLRATTHYRRAQQTDLSQWFANQ